MQKKQEDQEYEEFDKAIARALESLKDMDTIPPEDFPAMDLYMDQVTTFMARKLRSTLRNPGEDKILTKTMINNYAKNDLLPPPVKKKYSRDHLFALLFIFYFKSFLSISDIQTLIGPMMEHFFGKDAEFTVEDVYREILDQGHGARAALKKDMLEKAQRVKGIYRDAPEEHRDYLRKFAYICDLGYDIFLKKSIIEHLIDEMAMEQLSSEDSE